MVFCNIGIVNFFMNPDEVKKLILEVLPSSQVFVVGDGHHFDAEVISLEFANKSRLERQKMIYGKLSAYITSGQLHALSLKTYTEEEWGAISR